jgi:hypothetical protein
MYEKQVHKDGIRRAVMTSMGSATTRYFDTDGLRKLFTLGPEGQCEFLERLRERGLASAEDSPEARLTFHEGVMGVSSHDSLYTSKSLVTIIDDEKVGGNESCDTNKENPFSSAPAPPQLAISKNGPLQNGADRTQGGVSSVKVMGRSQRALLKSQEVNNARRKRDEKSTDLRDEEKRDQNLADQKDHVEQKILPVNERRDDNVADTLRKIDNVRASGNLVSALTMWMNVLEERYHDLEKHEKMKVHEGMASVAYELRWL